MELAHLKAVLPDLNFKNILRTSKSEFDSIQSICVFVYAYVFPSILFYISGIKHLYRLKDNNPYNQRKPVRFYNQGCFSIRVSVFYFHSQKDKK